MGTRIAAIEFEWTEEQKELIGQLTPESTGLVIGVRTNKKRIPHEFGGLDASEADKRLLEILLETNDEVLGELGQKPTDDRFASVLALALNW